MIEKVDIHEHVSLDDYASFAYLAGAVAELRTEARALVPALAGRTVWMVNSTARGGGVAEMLPKVVDILRELGVRTEWLVIGTDEQPFFALTKRLHNMIHGVGDPGFSADERAVYESVSTTVAAELEPLIAPRDILVVHDPQPLGAGALVARSTGAPSIWRCHIGLDQSTSATRSAWEFLEPFSTAYSHAVFTAPEYIPPYLAGRSSIIHPAIDPLSHKNRELSVTKLVGILCNSGLMIDHHPVLTPRFEHVAMRLQPDGFFAPAVQGDEVGLVYRPTITQVSRWDRLKGWRPLVEGFLHLKRRLVKRSGNSNQIDRRFEIVRLVLAGPDPAAIQDDPEGREVLDDLRSFYTGLNAWEQDAVALITLPMQSRKENALMVNALQRCSSIIVQNSLEEGFGLTVTEAMWKRVPVLGSSAAGIRQQIRDGIDGRLTEQAEDPAEIAENLAAMLSDPTARDHWSRSAQRRVHDEFLVFSQVRQWLRRLAEMVSA